MKRSFRFSWGKQVLAAGLLIFLSWQSLTLSGFCYADMKWLSERELVDRYLLLLDPVSPRLSKKEREEIIKINRERLQDCCYVPSVNDRYKQFKNDISNILLNSLILNRHFSEIQAYFPTLTQKETGGYDRLPYTANYSLINSCGSSLVERRGENLSNKEYNAAIERVKKHWKDIEQ